MGLKLWGQSCPCAIYTLIERIERLQITFTLKFGVCNLCSSTAVYFSLRFLFYFRTITFHKAPVLTLTKSNPEALWYFQSG